MNDNIYYKVHFARYIFFKYVTLVEQTGFDQLLNRFLSWVTSSPIILETVTKFKFKKCLWKILWNPFHSETFCFRPYCLDQWSIHLINESPVRNTRLILHQFKNQFAIKIFSMGKGINIWCQENWNPQESWWIFKYISDVK